MSQNGTAPIIDAVDFTTMAFSEPKSANAKGQNTIPLIYARKSQNDRSEIVFQLCKPLPAATSNTATPKEREAALNELPYIRSGFHLMDEPKFEKRDASKHTIFIAVPPRIAEKLRELDETNIAALQKNVKGWYRKGDLSGEVIRSQYGSVCTPYPTSTEVADSEKVACVRCKITEGKTEILVQDADNFKKLRKGDITDLRVNARVVPIMRLQGMYIRNIDSGGLLNVQRILVLHGNDVGASADFDLDDDMVIEEDFVPEPIPTTYVAGDAPPPPPPSVTEQTTIGGVAWNQGNAEGDWSDGEAFLH